jgi:ligand-binding SRPBCC domain-containing protein
MVYQKIFRQELPVSREIAWTFFSDPKNLAEITPRDMNFIMKGKMPLSKTYSGQIISYTVSPILKIPMTWVTEITHVQEPDYFVDVQRKGPFKMWHHQHHFKSLPSGHTEMTDILHYEIPLGWIGRIVNRIMVGKRVDQIFNYRSEVLKSFFSFDEKKRAGLGPAQFSKDH